GNRLLTQVNLAKRNVAVASLLCLLCDSGMEDAAHLFFRCDTAKDVMFWLVVGGIWRIAGLARSRNDSLGLMGSG
nr:RNA-directed DNA polymerase, eukaryota [Tanacetum cinerariifolium]GFC78731.1 RNA-directed DNA polymerase, eukaryota [Tanacetum cinerariifolium]